MSMDDAIRQHGFAVAGVFDHEGIEPDYAYTIGLSQFGLPELIVFGLPPEVMAHFCNALGGLFRAHGLPELDADLDFIAEGGYQSRLVPVPRTEADKYMHQALYRFPDYQAVQLVWPDRAHRWPWEPGCEVAKDQPVLRNRLQ